MVSLREFIFGKKSVISITAFSETTREGINKSYIPKFLYKPPYGYPRYVNLPYVRYLARTPYVEMCIKTILDEITALEWDIVPTEGMEEQADEVEIEHIRSFFMNPNTNEESFEEVFIRMPVRDVLEVESGVLNKIYNLKEELVEVVSRDGTTFTKNPDVHGMFTNRDDIIIPKRIVEFPDGRQEVVNPWVDVAGPQARERGAYFQFGWVSGPIPIPFGKKEIIWLEMNKRTDEHYGNSQVQILAKTLQRLLYDIESDLEYYNDNNIPKGIIGLEDSDSDEIDAFKDQWNDLQRKKDEFGQWKKMIHKVPFVNKKPVFERISFSSEEMELIEKQKWYSKMVWACFGVNATELGYTEDAQGQANQIVQSKVFRKKAINPILRLLMNKYNKQIVSEFGYMGLLKTKTGGEIEMPKYKFVFKVFDTDEERNKYELYKLQTESGLKTINEVRIAEGLEEVEWGDKPPREWQSPENTVNMNFGDKPFSEREKEAQKTDEARKIPKTEDPNKKKKDPDKKALTPKKIKVLDKFTKESVKLLNDNDISKGDILEHAAKTEQAKEKKIKKKAQTQESPLILKEGETPSNYKRLEKAIVYTLKENEEKLKGILTNELKKDILADVKDINTVIEQLKNILVFEGLRNITNAVVKNNYLKGWDEAEEQLDRNFIPDTNAIQYLANYTFQNIKGMQDDIANKLRQELQRGFMAGEGIDKIKARVTKIFDVGDNRAEMIARTETNRASNFGKLHAFQKADVPGKKEWVTHFDARTSDICKRLDGQVVGLDESFKDPKTNWEGPAAPAHVNCRSTWIFVPPDNIN